MMESKKISEILKMISRLTDEELVKLNIETEKELSKRINGYGKQQKKK